MAAIKKAAPKRATKVLVKAKKEKLAKQPAILVKQRRLHPDTNVLVDFETYYDKECSLKPLGYRGYCEHPDFEAYMVSIVGPGVSFVGAPEDAPWDLINGCNWWSWNAAFDSEVYKWLQETRSDVFKANAQEWNCAASLAVYFGAPRALAAAVKAVFHQDVSKGMRTWACGKRPEAIKAAGKWEEMLAYCLSDSEHALKFVDHYLPFWPAEERRLSLLSFEKANRGFCIDVPLVEKYAAQLEELLWRCTKGMPWAKGMSPGDKGILSTTQLAIQCRASDIPVPASTSEDDSRCRLWELEYGDKHPWVAAMREYRKANILLKRFKTMLRRVQPNGRCPYGIKYFGGHTGRWSGDAGLNPQNQAKESFKSVLMPELDIDVRGVIIAPPGKKLVISDLAQIEPRLVHWFGGQWEVLDRMQAGESIYEIHARNTMGWTGGNIKKENPKLQFLAKQRVLSLGYQCGGDRFRDRCIELGVPITSAEANFQVSDFRAKSKWLVELWTKLDSDFRKAGRSPEKQLDMELPSGRIMRYMNIKNLGGNLAARVEMGGLHRKFYGGMLFENLVQATAREVFADGMLRCEDAGVDVVFHAHDENVCEVDLGTDPRDVEQLMSFTPAWLEGCPIAAEASEGLRYKK